MVRFCKSVKFLGGKTAIVTGANTGIGYETALDFAKRGCRVILACRNQEKAEEARNKIVKATNNENVVVKVLNLELLSSVRDFAKDITETEDRLDLLINNAGAAQLPYKLTEDGLHVEMAVNYFSHFLLTILLLDLLKKSAPSRIINVSSVGAQFVCKLKIADLNKKAWNVYPRSKLCQILFTQELARQLQGTGVTVYSLHPGSVNTDILRNSSVGSWIASKTWITPAEGAQTSIYLALEEGIDDLSGQNFENCRRVSPYRGARDEKKAKELWEITEEMVGLRQK